MAARRVVRALPELFDDIDRQLGGPERSGFLSDHLFVIVDRFAESFDSLPAVPDEDPLRCKMLIGAFEQLGYVVAGALQADGAVELYWIEIDREPPWLEDDFT